MPPQVKVSKEQMLEAAIKMIREQGFESVNARSLAKELNCSIHPIFRAFETMEKLKAEIQSKAEDVYNEEMLSVNPLSEDGLHDLGIKYIQFAQKEKNLFRLIFMSNVYEKQSMSDIVDSAEADDAIIQAISQRTKLTKEHARDAFTAVWLTAHGIATLFATNNCQYSDKEIRRILGNTYSGIIHRLQEEERNGNE